jgi:hypothetical protein
MTGLIGWWPLHEQSGQANDLSGNGNHGTVNGATQGVAGKGGLTSYSFDGSNDYINIGLNGVSGGDRYTVVFWAKKTATATNNAGVFISGGYGGDNDGIMINSEDYSTTSVSYLVDNATVNRMWIDGNSVSNGASFTLNEWHHFAADLTVNSHDGGDHWIGANNNETNYYTGNISDFRIYNRALSPQEIQTLYEWGNGDYTKRSYHDGSDSGAVTRWKFDSDVNDSWSSNDASRNGPNFSSNSVKGQSLRFDGSGDTMNGSLGSYSEFTASLWINIEDDSNDSYPLWGDKNDGTSSSYEAPMIRINNGSLKFFGRADLNYSEYYTQNWAHIVYTASPEKDYYFFNGKIVETASTSGTVDWNNLNFGNRPGQSSYFKGKIDDFRIYNRALEPHEVFQLYQWGTRGRDMRKLTVNSRGDQ